MKILITGASGFIGGYLVEEALRKDWEVWAGIRKTSDKRYLTHSALHFIDLEYTDEAALTKQITKHAAEYGAWDYIIHNAGITKAIDEADYHRINHLYTVHLLHALQVSNNRPTKFVFMSSMGAVGPGDVVSGLPLTADDTPNPISEYGRSKLFAEEFIRSLTDIPWIILRPTGVYGPRERDYFVMLQLIKAGFNVSVGLKQKLLNFIHISDLARVVFLSLESPMIHKTWFVADGDIYTSDDFSNLLQEVLHQKKVLNIRIPLSLVKCLSIMAELVSRLSGKPTLLNKDKFLVMKQRNWTCDASLLERELNFKPAFSLYKGMEETVAWYTENGWL